MPDTKPQGEQPAGIDEVREAYERQKSRAEAAEGKLEKQAFDALGLNPEKGVGKAFKMVYKGTIEPDELDAIKGVLSDEFDYTPPTASPSAEEAPSKTAKPEVSQGEHALNQAASQSDPAPIDPAADARAKAAEEGDWTKEIEMGLLQGGIEL